MNDSTRYREEHSLLYWLWLDWKEKRKKKNGKGMIIVFGKETRARLLDCASYVDQCGDYLEKDNAMRSVVRDCRRLSAWLFKISLWPKKVK